MNTEFSAGQFVRIADNLFAGKHRGRYRRIIAPMSVPHYYVVEIGAKERFPIPEEDLELLE